MILFLKTEIGSLSFVNSSSSSFTGWSSFVCSSPVSVNSSSYLAGDRGASETLVGDGCFLGDRDCLSSFGLSVDSLCFPGDNPWLAGSVFTFYLFWSCFYLIWLVKLFCPNLKTNLTSWCLFYCISILFGSKLNGYSWSSSRRVIRKKTADGFSIWIYGVLPSMIGI